MGGVLRILQTGQFRLDDPLLVSADLPDHLYQIVLRAREEASARVFESAIAEPVDLLLLAGEVCDPARDRRGLWFLREQFQRLHKAGIDVVWADRTKPELLRAMDLPPNVRFLTAGHSIGFRLSAGRRSVEVEWSDLAGEQPVPGQTSDVAIRLERDGNGSIRAAEYAVRGQAARTHVAVVPVQREGRADQADQADQADRTGGAWLIHCQESGECRSRFVPTEIVRFVSQSIAIEETTTWGGLKGRLKSLMNQLRPPAGELTSVQAVLSGAGPVWDRLADSHALERLCSELRSDADSNGHPVWLSEIVCAPARQQLATWRRMENVSAALEAWEQLASGTGPLDPRRFAEPGDPVPEPPRPLSRSSMELRLVRELVVLSGLQVPLQS